jgi:ribosomal-protein-alanine N-acetyltransferase
MGELNPGWPAVLEAGPVTLRPPRRADAAEWSRIRLASRAWLEEWEPTSPLSWPARNSKIEFRRTLSRMRSAARAGTMLPFIVCYGGRLVGQMSVSNVIRGALRGCSVGYWVDPTVAGRGITPTALALVLDHCLTEVRLHRVEIDIRPENGPSLRVVEKLGIRKEGYYQRYLDIAGDWRDHLAFAVTVEDCRDGSMLSRLPALPVPPG